MGDELGDADAQATRQANPLLQLGLRRPFSISLNHACVKPVASHTRLWLRPCSSRIALTAAPSAGWSGAVTAHMILDTAALWLFGPVLASRAGWRFIVRVVLQQRERARLSASSPSRRSRPARRCSERSGSCRGFQAAPRARRRGPECRKSLQAPGSDRVRGRGRGGPLFDAQYTSTDTGLIYLRNRVYDPATAQFLSADPLPGDHRRAIRLHR